MKELNWNKKGILINGSYLSNLRFADDIVLFSESAKQLEIMLNDLNNESSKIGLELNTNKTKVMTNHTQDPIKVQGNVIEYEESYIYLGKQISFKQSRHRDEIERRVKITWKKFWSYKEILKSNLNTNYKKKVLDTCLLPCLSYASQTWIFNKFTANKIVTTQRAMERSILNLKRSHRVKNINIRKSTKVIDALIHSKKQKWKWAGHVARMAYKRWTKATTVWNGPAGKRCRGRPLEKWEDELKRIAGKDWQNKAINREHWNTMEEAFTQK